MADPLLDVQKLPDDVKVRLAELELELSEGNCLVRKLLSLFSFSLSFMIQFHFIVGMGDCRGWFNPRTNNTNVCDRNSTEICLISV